MKAIFCDKVLLTAAPHLFPQLVGCHAEICPKTPAKVRAICKADVERNLDHGL